MALLASHLDCCHHSLCLPEPSQHIRPRLPSLDVDRLTPPLRCPAELAHSRQHGRGPRRRPLPGLCRLGFLLQRVVRGQHGGPAGETNTARTAHTTQWVQGKGRCSKATGPFYDGCLRATWWTSGRVESRSTSECPERGNASSRTGPVVESTQPHHHPRCAGRRHLLQRPHPAAAQQHAAAAQQRHLGWRCIRPF